MTLTRFNARFDGDAPVSFFTAAVDAGAELSVFMILMRSLTSPSGPAFPTNSTNLVNRRLCA